MILRKQSIVLSIEGAIAPRLRLLVEQREIV